jgi:hypothetical protein
MTLLSIILQIGTSFLKYWCSVLTKPLLGNTKSPSITEITGKEN